MLSKDSPPGSKLPAGYINAPHGMMVRKALYDYQLMLATHFLPGQIALGPSFIQSYIAKLWGGVSDCSTFRVRSASGPTVILRLACTDGNGKAHAYDATLTVEDAPPFRIAAISGAPTNEPY